jgi:hypothetical protein
MKRMGCVVSKTSEIYAAYLDKFKAAHPGMVEPRFIDNYAELRLLTLEIRRLGKMRSACCKAFAWFPVGTYDMPDGRVIEVALTSSRIFEIVAVFNNRSDHDKYEQPLSFNAYFERW